MVNQNRGKEGSDVPAFPLITPMSCSLKFGDFPLKPGQNLAEKKKPPTILPVSG